METEGWKLNSIIPRAMRGLCGCIAALLLKHYLDIFFENESAKLRLEIHEPAQKTPIFLIDTDAIHTLVETDLRRQFV